MKNTNSSKTKLIPECNANLVRQIAWSKTADAVVLFNRFYNPDVDINQMSIISSHVFSNAEDVMPSLRWIALLSPQFKNINFAATTGVYTGEDVIKQLLVGADAVQIVSAIYKHGPNFINTILNQIKEWMQQKKFNKISDFKGKLNMENSKNASVYERIQFMKYYGSIE
jgi:dihydroorotate dehydrogenase (fumarate)